MQVLSDPVPDPASQPAAGDASDSVYTVTLVTDSPIHASSSHQDIIELSERLLDLALSRRLAPDASYTPVPATICCRRSKTGHEFRVCQCKTPHAGAVVVAVDTEARLRAPDTRDPRPPAASPRMWEPVNTFAAALDDPQVLWISADGIEDNAQAYRAFAWRVESAVANLRTATGTPDHCYLAFSGPVVLCTLFGAIFANQGRWSYLGWDGKAYEAVTDPRVAAS
jgi:hypothetical protein